MKLGNQGFAAPHGMNDRLVGLRCAPAVWNRALEATRPPYMLIVLGILFAVAPAVVWTTIARTRPVGFAIGGTLLAGASLLISV